MKFSSLNNFLYFISLITVRQLLPCITEGIGHNQKNNYASEKQKGTVERVGRDKEIMSPLRISYF